MKSPRPLGGVIHTYQKYDPRNIPSPTQPPPDLVSGAFEHLLAYGDIRELTDEELARAVRLDPSQIAGLGPSLESLMAMLRQRKRKILATYETDRVQAEAAQRVHDLGREIRPPRNLEKRYQRALAEEQLHELERLWYHAGDDRGLFARQLVELVARLGDKYQVDELAAKYGFTGRTRLTIPKALEIKEELETIDRLLKQLEEAAKTAQIGVIDLEALAEFAEPGDVRSAPRPGPADRGVRPPARRAAGTGKNRPGLPAHAQGLPHLPGSAPGADLQPVGSLADRPPPGAGGR